MMNVVDKFFSHGRLKVKQGEPNSIKITCKFLISFILPVFVHVLSLFQLFLIYLDAVNGCKGSNFTKRITFSFVEEILC